jgi:hypothetical protein
MISPFFIISLKNGKQMNGNVHNPVNAYIRFKDNRYIMFYYEFLETNMN